MLPSEICTDDSEEYFGGIFEEGAGCDDGFRRGGVGGGGYSKWSGGGEVEYDLCMNMRLRVLNRFLFLFSGAAFNI